ncbi:MAG: hypothetical protein AAB464_00980 [Patescibacteria group bacterium]
MKNKESIFIIVSGLLFVFLSLFIVYSIKFLFANVGKALEVSTNDSRQAVRINFDGLKKIGIMKD